MKRFIAAAAAVSLISAVNVYAGSASSEFVVKASNINVGDTFEVELDLTENTGFTSLDAFIKYDPAVIRLEGAGSVADDALSYTQGSAHKTFIDDSTLNMMTAFKPESGDKDYSGKADGSLSAAEIGIVKISDFVRAADENNLLKKQEGTGTLCTLKFTAVGGGSTTLQFADSSFNTITPAENWSADTSVTINVNGGSSSTVTEAATETTTASSSSSGSGSTENRTTQSTTQAQTETTTVVEATTETTTQTTKTASFNDISGYAWAEGYINSLAAKGVINGYSDGSFKPANNVKRCDFVVMIARALDLKNDGSGNFSDVPANAYYADAVAAAKAAGIVNGNGDGTFSPDSFITRQDMMLIAKGALEYKGVQTTADTSVLDRFADNAQISAYARNGVAAMVSAGVVNGTGQNIEPKGNTTRAQAAVIISKILEK